MSEINSQALREAAVAIETVATPQKLQAFRMKVTPSVVLALLDEIKRLEDTNIDAMCRIAELEAREVELPDGYEPRMGHPINSGERVVM
ncbi:ead/Ea22-like family protein, partial [Escherichia coli]